MIENYLQRQIFFAGTLTISYKNRNDVEHVSGFGKESFFSVSMIDAILDSKKLYVLYPDNVKSIFADYMEKLKDKKIQKSGANRKYRNLFHLFEN